MSEKFPRRCDATGVGMHEGFVVCDGLYHFSEERYLVDYLRSQETISPGLNDESLLENAYEDEEYYYTEWEIEDSDYWYEYGVDGHLVMVSEQQSTLKDVYVLYDEDKDWLYQYEDGVIVTYHNIVLAWHWEAALNEAEDATYKYEGMDAIHLPDHQIVRLHNQITNK